MLTRSRTRQLVTLGKQTLASLPVGYLGEQVGKEIAKRAVNSTLEMVKRYTSKGRRGSGAAPKGTGLIHRRRYKTKSRGLKRKKTAKSYIPNKKRTKFAKKVTKVLEAEDPVNIVSRTQYQQLRQTNDNRIAYYYQDKQGYDFAYGTGYQVLHDASIAFNSKPLSNNILGTTGNLAEEIKVHVLDTSVSMYFKSTSNHVVNIEIYECRSKNNQDDAAQVDSGDSFSDQKSSAADLLGANPIQNMFGCSGDMFIELHKNWTVKRHNLKLLPGEAVSKIFSVCKQRTYNLALMQNGGNLWKYPKGSLNFFFRVLNDPTVSGTTGQINHWPSNSQGGVALRLRMKTRIRAPPDCPLAQRKAGAFVFDASTQGSGTDQQVAFQNPITTVTPI